MRDTVLKAAFAATLVAGSLVAGQQGAGAETIPSDIPYFKVEGEAVPLCEIEDGSTQEICAWVASEQGNGQGVTYIAVDYGRTYIYLEDVYY